MQSGVWWRGRLVTAIDGTVLGCPDTPANLAVYRHGGSGNGGTWAGGCYAPAPRAG
jgi:hypothetical protein